MAATYRIENELYRLDVEAEAGRLIRVRDKQCDGDLIAEPARGENFRLLLPLPGVECNYIDGREQTLSAGDATDDSLTLTWRGPLTSGYGTFDLDVVLRIELAGPAIEFTCEVRNGTEHQLAEVWYPILGGMKGLGSDENRRDTTVLLPYGNGFWRQDLFTDFGNTRGQTLGIPGEEHAFWYPGPMPMPWISLHNPVLNRGLYFAALEETPRVKTIRFAQDPPEEREQQPAVAMNWAHFPYTPPGETFRGARIVLQGHDGDWRQAAALYRRWFDEHFPVVDPKAHWIRSEPAFLHTMFLLPEDNIQLRFQDLPQWGAAAKERGIYSLCIAGWNVGGHDRGYPQYEPDPRLGTWEELEAGVRACQQMGLRVYFFVNCQPTDMTTDWYEKELHQYRILDPYGVPYFIINYWGMGTLGARSHLPGGAGLFTARPFTEINPAHPEVRELLVRQMRRLAEIGADGVHIDKFFQTPMDFNPRLTWTSPDRAHHEGMLQYVEEMLAACRAVNPEFCFSYEGGWDRLMSYSDVSWWGPTDSPMKEAFPQRALTAGVEQPYDYHGVNNAVLSGDVLLIGPANYLCGADYPPLQGLLEYIAEINRIRRQLWDIVSLGRIVDRSHGIFQRQQPALHLGGPFAESDGASWTLFRDTYTGRRGAVLVNSTPHTLTAAEVVPVDNPSGPCCVYQPFAPDRDTRFPVSLPIPGEHAVFIVEK